VAKGGAFTDVFPGKTFDELVTMYKATLGNQKSQWLQGDIAQSISARSEDSRHADFGRLTPFLQATGANVKNFEQKRTTAAKFPASVRDPDIPWTTYKGLGRGDLQECLKLLRTIKEQNLSTRQMETVKPNRDRPRCATCGQKIAGRVYTLDAKKYDLSCLAATVQTLILLDED
jgi:hypothetical protein